MYHTHFKPLEWNFVEKRDYNTCYIKLVVNAADKERVVGFHYFGPHAGEVTQVQEIHLSVFFITQQ